MSEFQKWYRGCVLIVMMPPAILGYVCGWLFEGAAIDDVHKFAKK